MINENKKMWLIEENIYSALLNVRGSAYDNKAKLYEKLVSLKIYNKITRKCKYHEKLMTEREIWVIKILCKENRSELNQERPLETG